MWKKGQLWIKNRSEKKERKEKKTERMFVRVIHKYLHIVEE